MVVTAALRVLRAVVIARFVSGARFPTRPRPDRPRDDRAAYPRRNASERRPPNTTVRPP